MRSPGPEAKTYFGAGVGAGGGVGASSLSTSPAGVRKASIGVVSGVGGAGAGVALSAECPALWLLEPQPAPRAAARVTNRQAIRMCFIS